jgi:hypothetical protein
MHFTKSIGLETASLQSHSSALRLALTLKEEPFGGAGNTATVSLPSIDILTKFWFIQMCQMQDIFPMDRAKSIVSIFWTVKQIS